MNHQALQGRESCDKKVFYSDIVWRYLDGVLLYKIYLMDTIIENLKYLQENIKVQNHNSSILKAGEIFSDKCEYINQYNLFISKYNAYPHIIIMYDINGIKANEWFLKNYSDKIKDYHVNILETRGLKFPHLSEAFYFIDKDLIVNIHASGAVVRFIFRDTEINIVKEIYLSIRKLKNRKKKSDTRISLLISTSEGIETKSLKIKKPTLRIEDNYNEDFIEIHSTILKRLNKKDDKGLVLLHGKPGTGKTSYIRYLISRVNKKVIFLPPNMASAITNPELISILVDNSNSIFVIEDAENIVIDRERNGQSSVSALLNISDGLLSDCLNIQIICSFNTDISKVDSALMRKGRMIAKYEFKELSIEKAQALSNKLSFKSIISKPMTLTEIYNQEEKNFIQQNERMTIGFRRDIA